MKLTADEMQELHRMLSTELAEAALDADPERAERKVRILRRAVRNVELRMRTMEPGPLGDVAHSDVVAAAREFAEAQLGSLGDREVVARLAIGASESRAFLFERMGAAFVEVTGALASADALHGLLSAAAGFVSVAMGSLDQAKRKAIKHALDAGAALGIDVAARTGVITLVVGRGDQAVVIAVVAPEQAAREIAN